MSFSAQTLSKDAPTNVDTNTVIYAVRAQDIDRSEFSVAGLTLPEEKKLSISHETRKGGVVGHRVQLSRTAVDAFGVPGKVTVSLVIARDPNTAITNALILEEVNRLIDFCIHVASNGNITAVLNREV